MTYKIAINGFGRIGRLTLRAIIEREVSDFQVVAINDLGDMNSNLHLLKYDSVHGIFKNSVNKKDESVFIDHHNIEFSKEPDPKNLPWKRKDIDLVIECTGRFTSRINAQSHLDSGAKRVLISAPASDPDITVVYGINHKKIESNHRIISNGSCTTNCLAPIAYLVDELVGIESGYMTTVHSVTGDQNTIDTLHKDLRRARNSLISIIPTSTGAARAVADVLPNLSGKIDGSAIRVPTSNVSLIDFKFYSKRNTTEDELSEMFINASKTNFKNIIQTTDEPLVSPDINHNPHSSVVDLKELKVLNNKFCRVLSWYDNEWGFSNRLIDVILKLAK